MALGLDRLGLSDAELRERRAAERTAYERRAFHDKASFEGVAAASGAEAVELSERLNAQMAVLELDPAKRSWFKLFKHMDLDGSGKITYEELRDMVRGELMQLSEEKLPEPKLKALGHVA